MHAWVIEGLIGKAAWEDDVAGSVKVAVAAQLLGSYELYDDGRIDTVQRVEFCRAVGEVLVMALRRIPVTACCLAGQIRAPAVACVAAALLQETTFQEQFEKVRGQDVADPPPMGPLVLELFPQLWGDE